MSESKSEENNWPEKSRKLIARIKTDSHYRRKIRYRFEKIIKVSSLTWNYQSHVKQYVEWAYDDDDKEIEEKLDLEEIVKLIKKAKLKGIIAEDVMRQARIKVIYERKEFGKSMNVFMEDDLLTIYKKIIENKSNSNSTILNLLRMLVYTCSGSQVKIKKIINAKLIPSLLKALRYNNGPIIEQIMLILAEISIVSITAREMILNIRFLKWIGNFLDDEIQLTHDVVKRGDKAFGNILLATSWAILCFCKQKDKKTFSVIEKLIISRFDQITDYSHDRIRGNLLHALFLATIKFKNENENSHLPSRTINMISNESIIKQLIGLITQDDNDSVLYSILILSNIISSGEMFAQKAIKNGLLINLKNALDHLNEDVQQEAAFILANITSGNCIHIESVIESNLFSQMIDLLYFGNYLTQCEIINVISNITLKGIYSQKLYLLNLKSEIENNWNLFDAIAVMLTSNEDKMIRKTLLIYNNLLDFAYSSALLTDALAQLNVSSAYYWINDLINYNNEKISKIAQQIVNKFFKLIVNEE